MLAVYNIGYIGKEFHLREFENTATKCIFYFALKAISITYIIFCVSLYVREFTVYF